MSVPSVPPDDPEWVLLNVGGKYFTTTRTTLATAESHSKLAGIFSEEPLADALAVKRDAQGAYMFDRDPVYFKPLLNYLRYKKLVLDKGVSAAGVLEEARYFGIESLVPDLEAMSQKEEVEPNRNVAEPGFVLNRYRPLTRDDVVHALTRMPIADLRFQGAGFTGANLAGLDLNGANFKWAEMSFCNLSHANVSHCNFEGADLTGANLEGQPCFMPCWTAARCTGSTSRERISGEPAWYAVTCATQSS